MPMPQGYRLSRARSTTGQRPGKLCSVSLPRAQRAGPVPWARERWRTPSGHSAITAWLAVSPVNPPLARRSTLLRAWRHRLRSACSRGPPREQVGISGNCSPGGVLSAWSPPCLGGISSSRCSPTWTTNTHRRACGSGSLVLRTAPYAALCLCRHSALMRPETWRKSLRQPAVNPGVHRTDGQAALAARWAPAILTGRIGHNCEPQFATTARERGRPPGEWGRGTHGLHTLEGIPQRVPV